MPLVVHVEAVLHCVFFQVGDEAGNVDPGHSNSSVMPGLAGEDLQPATTVSRAMSRQVLTVLSEAAEAVAASLVDLRDWGLAGTRDGQYRHDLRADDAVVAVLRRHGYGVLSEESGLVDADASVVVIVDPVDGSTNASLGIPWFATSLCAVRDGVPIASLVVNLASDERFEAVRGEGAWRNGEPITSSGCAVVGDAVVGLSGLPPHHLGWAQFRALGAAALDMCAVACGRLDAYVDCSFDAHGVWDYAGALLVCEEAGATVRDALGRDLIVMDHAARRTPVAAASAELCDSLVAQRVNWH